MNRHIWVIEIDFGEGDGWEPTAGVGLNREDGRRALITWRDRNPDDKFRVREYVPYSPK